MAVICLFPLSENESTIYAASASASVSPSASQSPSASASPSASGSPSPSAPAVAPFGGHASLATSLLGYWTLSEATAHTRYDSKDTTSYDLLERNPTVRPVQQVSNIGPSGATAAYFSSAVQADTNNPCLQVPNGSALFPGSGNVYEEFTFNIWFKGVARGVQWQNQIWMAAASTGGSVYIDSDGQVNLVSLGWYDGAFKTAQSGFAKRGNGVLAPHMYTWTISKIEGVGHVMMDTVAQETSSSVVDKAFTSLSSTVYMDLYLGMRGTDGFVSTNGYMSHAACWSRRLADIEIQDLFNNGYGLFY